MKAFIYGRYSSHAQKDTSIEQQFNDIRAFCQQQEIKIVGEFADRGISGKTDNRPEFQRMIREAAKGRVQLIICWKVDRFARNRYDSAMYKARLKRYGVRVMYVKEAIPEGPEGILLESILEGSAEYYSANLAQNIKRGMRANALECKVNNGGWALGYCKGPDDRFAIDPPGAAIVREVYEMYADGASIVEICTSLNTRGLRTSRGVAFNKNSLRKMLRNESYIGVYKYGDVRIEGGMPQIIERGLFEQVQDMIKKNARAPACARDLDFLLTGKLFCGHCGSPMIGISGTGKGGRKFYYYICVKKRRDHTCDKATVGKDWLERFVVETTVKNILVDEVIEKIVDAAVALQEHEKDTSVLDALTSRLRETEKVLKNVMTAIEQGIITPTTKERLTQLEREKVDLVDQIETESIVKPTYTREQLIYWMEKFRGGDLNDESFRNTIIETFVSSVYLYDGQLRIVYNYCGKSSTVTLDLIDGCDKEGATGVFAFGVPSSTTMHQGEHCQIIIMESVFVLIVPLPAAK